METRKKNRLKGYDYSQPNYYHITVCAKNKECLFWDCRGEYYSPEKCNYTLSDIGKNVKTAIDNIPKKYKMILVDKYVIMPNHIHMLLIIKADECGRVILAPTISTVIMQMKSYVTKTIGRQIWQKSFYDEIIRNQKEYENIWKYIDSNPLKWNEDKYYK